jgi:hypothetical protein
MMQRRHQSAFNAASFAAVTDECPTFSSAEHPEEPANQIASEAAPLDFAATTPSARARVSRAHPLLAQTNSWGARQGPSGALLMAQRANSLNASSASRARQDSSAVTTMRTSAQHVAREPLLTREAPASARRAPKVPTQKPTSASNVMQANSVPMLAYTTPASAERASKASLRRSPVRALAERAVQERNDRKVIAQAKRALSARRISSNPIREPQIAPPVQKASIKQRQGKRSVQQSGLESFIRQEATHRSAPEATLDPMQRAHCHAYSAKKAAFRQRRARVRAKYAALGQSGLKLMTRMHRALSARRISSNPIREPQIAPPVQKASIKQRQGKRSARQSSLESFMCPRQLCRRESSSPKNAQPGSTAQETFGAAGTATRVPCSRKWESQLVEAARRTSIFSSATTTSLTTRRACNAQLLVWTAMARQDATLDLFGTNQRF